jgi:hypothetical protein
VLAYFGVQSLYQFKKPYVAWSPLLGTEVRLGRKVSLNLEAHWYQPDELDVPGGINFSLPVNGHGALGVALGASFFPGGWYE